MSLLGLGFLSLKHLVGMSHFWAPKGPKWVILTFSGTPRDIFAGDFFERFGIYQNGFHDPRVGCSVSRFFLGLGFLSLKHLVGMSQKRQKPYRFFSVTHLNMVNMIGTYCVFGVFWV